MNRFASALVLVLLLGLASFADTRTALATVSSCDFTPKIGGPGTVLHIACGEVYQPAVVNLVVAQATAGPGGFITSYKRIGAPLGTIQPDPQGGIESSGTVVIPNTLPDGTRINERHLGILFTDESGNPLSELPVRPFEFTAIGLPATGFAADVNWLLSGLLCTTLLAGGLLLRRNVVD